VQLLLVNDNEQRTAAEAAFAVAKKGNAEALALQLEGLMRKTKIEQVKTMCSVLVQDLAPARSLAAVNAQKQRIKEEEERQADEMQESDEEDEEDEPEKKVNIANIRGKTKELMQRFKS